MCRKINHKIKLIGVSLLFLAAFFLAMPLPAGAVRIKDLASFGGVRDNQLVGYGLVVGLSGTGDKKDSTFTMRSMVNMLEKMGVSVDIRQMKPKNVASVMVTAKMPVSAKPGSPMDITISSVGDATSLQGGVLLQTPLTGVDGKIYAMAQGPITLGGFSVEGAAASSTKNVVTVGRIPGGAIVERSVPFNFNSQDKVVLNLFVPDFSTTMQVAERLNAAMGGQFAKALDVSTVELSVPAEYRNNLVPLLASVENIEITPDSPAKVVVDEKTGTIVLGREVRISRVAVAHGNLQVMVQEGMDVSQPAPFSQGQTVVAPVTNLNVTEQNRRLSILEGASLQELVDGLNAIGATPRDLISILRTLKAAGALHAELEVI